MISGLYFQDLLDFCDFLRFHGSKVREKGKYTLLRLREHSGKPAAVLFGLEEEPGEKLLYDARKVFVEERPGGVLAVKRAGEKSVNAYEITRRTSSKNLAELAQPIPWREEPQKTGHLIFWLQDPETAGRLVGDSFRLGNDRIQFAQVEAVGIADLALRIDSPSYFLVQRAGETPGVLGIFYPATEDLYLPWGWEHPLQDLWAASEGGRKGEWVFFFRDGNREHVAPLRWEDAYDAAEFDFQFTAEEIWRQRPAGEEDLRFNIPLSLERRASPREAELWMLHEEDLVNLENLLALVDQQDVSDYLLSAQRAEDGRKLYFVREKRGGEKRRYLDFGGHAFASYKGFNNLFLPVDGELHPELRRDVYRVRFQLQPDSLTLLCFPEGGKQPQILRIREDSFGPLLNLVDYLITMEEEKIAPLISNSVFDLDVYLRAPAAMVSASSKSKELKKKAEEEKREEEQTREVGTPKEEKIIREEAGEEAEPPDISSIEHREAEGERALILEGQSLERWLDLLRLKLEAGRQLEARLCYIEAFWLARDETADEIRVQFYQFLKKLTAKGKGDEISRLMLFLLQGRGGGDKTEADWLEEAVRRLLAEEKSLRMKERWLLWGELLRFNKDTREQARVREEIRAAVAGAGITLNEIPIFIRNRLFLDRDLSERENGEGEEVERDKAAAANHLETIAAALGELDGCEAGIAPAGQAILARAWSRVLDRRDVAAALIERAEERLASKPRDQYPLTWCLVKLYSAHGAAQNPRAFETYYQEFEELARGLSREQQAVLRHQDASLSDRENESSPAAFLSEENVARFYPTGGNYDSGPAGSLADSFREAKRSGDLPLMVRLLGEALELARQKDSNPVIFSRLLGLIAEGLNRVKWDGRVSPLVSDFEQLVRKLEKEESGDDVFFAALGEVNLAEGLLAIGHDDWAARKLQEVTRLLDSCPTPLDFIDAGAAVMRCVENFPLKKRTPLIEVFMDCFRGHVQKNDERYARSLLDIQQLYRLLDQAVEASVSKDRFTLGLYRDYQLQEEFLILQRVLNEDFTG